MDQWGIGLVPLRMSACWENLSGTAYARPTCGGGHASWCALGGMKKSTMVDQPKVGRARAIPPRRLAKDSVFYTSPQAPLLSRR